MYIREIKLLYICALVHFRGIQCALVIKPQNLAVVSGESVILHCASDISKGNIVWGTRDPGLSGIDDVYNQGLTESFSSYISVSESEDGNCSLNINASLTAANIYICTEANSGQEASAELIVLKSGLQCNSTNFKGSVRVICVTVSAGNWTPVVECKQWQTDRGLTVLPGNQSSTVHNNVITLTWNYASKNEWFHIFCETAWTESGRNKELSATNIPKYFNPVLAYNGTCVSNSGTISNNSSTECPECPARSTARPVATSTNCPECPTGATKCPECPSGATECPESPTETTKCPECPTETTKCPECPTETTKCPKCPTGTTKCPECPTGTTKCPECPTGATECPEYPTGTTKCPECPTGATKCPECPTGATKCPECPVGATVSPVTTAAKRPAYHTERTKCPERSTACLVADTADGPEYIAGATAYNMTFAGAFSAGAVVCFVGTFAPCLVAAASNNSSVTADAASSVRAVACLVKAFAPCLVSAASNNNSVTTKNVSSVGAVACLAEAFAPCLVEAASNCSVTAVNASSVEAAECFVKNVTTCIVAAACNNCSPTAAAVLCSLGSASECRLGAGCLTSVILNCVFVLAGTGLGDAEWEWQSKKNTYHKKPKSTEQGPELKNPDQDISQDTSVLSLDHQQA